MLTPTTSAATVALPFAIDNDTCKVVLARSCLSLAAGVVVDELPRMKTRAEKSAGKKLVELGFGNTMIGICGPVFVANAAGIALMPLIADRAAVVEEERAGQ